MLRQGQIYWVRDCPPLLGKVAAPHAVIILNPAAVLRQSGTPVLTMVISSSVPAPDSLHVPLPNRQTHHPCATGLDRPCWAVGRWMLRVQDTTKLGPLCGHLSGRSLRDVLLAAKLAIESGALPIDHPP